MPLRSNAASLKAEKIEPTNAGRVRYIPLVKVNINEINWNKSIHLQYGLATSRLGEITQVAAHYPLVKHFDTRNDCELTLKQPAWRKYAQDHSAHNIFIRILSNEGSSGSSTPITKVTPNFETGRGTTDVS